MCADEKEIPDDNADIPAGEEDKQDGSDWPDMSEVGKDIGVNWPDMGELGKDIGKQIPPVG